jgi:precorrin-4/cobalt-precorrin-4 C11-methyltransferase
MTVYFIGAGPGDPELITLKGARLLGQCQSVLYTGSLVPKALLEHTRADANVASSAGMNLDEIIAFIQQAHAAGHDVARLQTGDLSIYSSLAEQTRRLDPLNIPWEVIPGVSSFQASAAALGQELTLPEECQTIILSRANGRTPVPVKEQLASLAAHEATLCLFLSAGLIDDVVAELLTVYPDTWPIAVVERASQPEQRVLRGTLANIAEQMKAANIRQTAMLIISKVLTQQNFVDSRLYAADFSHAFRTADASADNGAAQS